MSYVWPSTSFIKIVPSCKVTVLDFCNRKVCGVVISYMEPLVLSFTKGGAIYVPSCNQSQLLFPLDIPPTSWSSCGDAGDYTWSVKQDDLSAINSVDRVKLARSMGFCPHNRCQLGNLTNARNDGLCPANLCYTKLENGGRSFGACCFINNEFNSGSLIGFYDKTQHAPKPIYKKSRVILGDAVGGTDETYESFINANQIHPGIIATQCPLSNTVGDVLRMLVEQNISLWIQLAPFVNPAEPHRTGQCTMSPSVFAETSLQLNNSYASIENVQQISSSLLGLQQPTFSVDQFTVQYHSQAAREIYNIKNTEDGLSNDIDGSSDGINTHKYNVDTLIRNGVTLRRQNVTSIWYSNWKDFATPAAEDETDLLKVVDLTTQTIRDGGKVLVSCLSGRGRSGTFSALVIGKLEQVTTHSELVDVIVRMREQRDGMLETPAQFRFVSRLLGLPSTADCGVYCKVHRKVAEHESYRLIIALLCGALLVLLPVLFVLRKARI